MKRYQKYLAALFVVLLACVGYLLISQASTISREQAITIAEDAGITEVKKGTITCMAIGPAPSTSVDKVTGELPLFK